MLLNWIIGFFVIVLAAIVIIKLIVPKDPNPESNSGILEHPSTFEKQPIEYVDKSLKESSKKHNVEDNG